MSPLTGRCPASGVCFPRVSGDEPVSEANVLVGAGFSPRERG